MAGNRHIFIVLMVLILATSAVCAEESNVHPGVTIALPQDCNVKIRWVCPPLDEKMVEESKWSDIVFAVDSAGCPWLGHDSKIILSPTKQYQFSLDLSFGDLVCLDSGAMLLSSTTHIGFPVPPKDKQFDSRGLPRATFQPIAEMPFPSCALFPGAANCLYLVGHDPTTDKKEVYLLRPEKGGIRQFTRVFASNEDITAVTGDGDSTYIATDRLVLKVLNSGAVSKVYVHPTRPIRTMAYDPRIGLFYATDAGVGFIGSNGSVELLATSEPRIYIQKGTLYVFLRKSYGVLALDNVEDLKRFSLAFKDVPASKSSEVKIASIRFFEAGEEAPDPENRSYAATFKRATTRRVYCEIGLKNLFYNKRGHKQTFGLEVCPPGQTSGGSCIWEVDFQPDVPRVWTYASIGSDTPGTIYPGEYTVRVYLNGAKADERKLIIEGDATVLEAASYGDTARLRALLAKGADANEVGADGLTPLLATANNVSLENVKLLLAHGADVNARNSDGKTALHVVHLHDDSLQITKLLLDRGADPNIPDNGGGTALHNAVRIRSTQIMRALLEHKANPNLKDNYGTTPLHYLSHELTSPLKPEAIELLLKHGANPNLKDNDGMTPLHYLSLGKHTNPAFQAKPEAIELLLKHGANPNVRNQSDSTPLYGFCSEGNVEAVRLLIKYKADVNAVRKSSKDSSGFSPLSRAINGYLFHGPGVRDRFRETIHLLTASGAQLLPHEAFLAFEKGMDGLRDKRLIKSCLDMNAQLVTRCSPEDPGSRALVLDRWMRLVFSTIAASNFEDSLGTAIRGQWWEAGDLCLGARKKADMWGMLAKYPEISFNCGLLCAKNGDTSDARLYLEEYLRLAPNGSAASKAKELLGR